MKKLIIIRGPSGSGKSTLAYELMGYLDHKTIGWHEADSYFIEEDKASGDRVYNFDATNLGRAHNKCQHKVVADMAQEVEIVIVSNTSTTLKEMKPYLAMAEDFGYDVDYVQFRGNLDPEVLAERTIHNVPIETIKKQQARMVYTPSGFVIDLNTETEDVAKLLQEKWDA